MVDFADCIVGLPVISDDAFCNGFSGCGNPAGMRPTAENLNAVLRRMYIEGANTALELSIVDGDLILSSDGDPVATVALPVSDAWRAGDVKMTTDITPVQDGWALCDGTLGTPDMRDKFVIAAGPTYPLGDTGGTTDHNHAMALDPAVTGVTLNEVSDPNVDGSGGGVNALTTATSLTDPGHTHTGGSDDADHIPPYYSLAFIMKLP